ncbi:hypothetical protein SEA_OBLADI_144 [Gordonia phage ObLaDi]|uniref:Uncharacterized protein n=1 Tax=Gordonia phage ObLaDi TaxID=2978487 RepID=A0A977PQ75_9CAUD|nr:hypothetical protein SEA_OBLADI_144 [Gordonia phage ObLaDi]
MDDKSMWRMEIELVYREDTDQYEYRIRGVGPNASMVTPVTIDESDAMFAIEDALTRSGALK